MRTRNRKGNLSPEDLDEVLADIYTEVKEKDGSDYGRGSLGVILAFLDRYLKIKGYKFSIIRGILQSLTKF